MRRISIELPKYRLQLHVNLVKRRKPLVEEPLMPTTKEVNKKYRTGTLPAKFVRYLAEHKNARKIFAANFVALVAITSFLPSTNSNVFAEADASIIQAQNTLITEKGMQLPLGHIKINQNYSFFHPAIDFGGVIGDAVKPIKAGVVTFSGYTRDGYGNLIVINHGQDLESYYAHLSKIEVKTGEGVTMDKEIGKLGSTGHSTGPHLHLEILLKGIHINPLTVLSR